MNLAQLDEAAKKKIVEDLADKLMRHVCLFCAKEFPTKALLETHFWDHNEDKVELECLICGAGFWKKDDLHLHMQDHIKSATPQAPPSPTSPMFKLSKQSHNYIHSVCSPLSRSTLLDFNTLCTINSRQFHLFVLFFRTYQSTTLFRRATAFFFR